MNDYQINTLRRRFAERGYEPLNRSKHDESPMIWVAIGMAAGFITAAFLLF